MHEASVYKTVMIIVFKQNHDICVHNTVLCIIIYFCLWFNIMVTPPWVCRVVFCKKPRCIQLSWSCFQHTILIYLCPKPPCIDSYHDFVWKQNHDRLLHHTLVHSTCSNSGSISRTQLSLTLNLSSIWLGLFMTIMMMMMLTVSHTMAHMRLTIALLQYLADLELVVPPLLANSAPETCQTWQIYSWLFNSKLAHLDHQIVRYLW